MENIGVPVIPGTKNVIENVEEGLLEDAVADYENRGLFVVGNSWSTETCCYAEPWSGGRCHINLNSS